MPHRRDLRSRVPRGCIGACGASAAIGLLLAGWLSPARAAERQPLGAWFAGYERLTFDDEIGWGSGRYVISQYNNEFYTPFRTADLSKYSAVYFGRSAGKRLTPEDRQALERWVAGGGNLLISGEEGQRLFGNQPPDWLGIERWSLDNPVEFGMQRADHALAKALRDVPVSDADWRTNSAAVGRPGAVSVLGKEALSGLLVAEHGKGKIVYLAGSLAPRDRPKYAEKQFVRDLSPLAARVWQNLFDFLGTPRRDEIIRQAMATKAAGKGAHVGLTPRRSPLVAWWRFQRATPLGARLYVPPYPQQGDELSELKLDLGRGERSRQPFFVTSLASQRVAVAATDLVGSGGARIPAADCPLFVQERPTAAYTKAAYWLLPLGDSLPLAANENYTFWLTLRSAAATAPGTYRGAIEFRDAATHGQVLLRLPLVAEVWDVPTPSSDLLHFELEHIWFTMPGGYWIEKDRSRKFALTLDGQKVVETAVNDQAVLANYIRALGDLEVDFAQNWSDVDKLYTLAFVRLRENGKLLSDEIEQHPERFRSERLPALDFSFGYDAQWEAAIAAGMRYAAMNYQLAGDGSLGLAHRIARDNKLTAESELARRVRNWYWSEYVKYLRERGLLGVYTKIHDEFGPAGVADFVTSAKAIRAAGIRTYTTTYNFDRDPKAIAAIDPHLNLWHMAWPRQSPFELYRELKIPFEAGNEVWGTTASSFWGNGEGLRAAGWMAARLGYGGVHTHGYMRWHWNDHEGCMVGPDRPYNSVAVTNGAEGMMEGRYLAQLRRLIAYAQRTGRAADVAAAIDREWQTSIIGVAGMEAGPNCLLPLRHQPGITGIDATWWPDISVSPATFAIAKRKVLVMTLRLERAIGDVPRNVRYGDFDVVRDGKAMCALVADAAAATFVRETIPELAKPARGTGAMPQIVIGTLEGDAVRRVVERAAPGEFTSHYPRPGHYAIRQLAAASGQPTTLLIVGGDAAGVRSGLSHWMRLLVSEKYSP